jgi:hypothetical protein
VTAVELPDLYQRAALIVARWSGARRDEIRRLAVDCLDSGPDGASPRTSSSSHLGHRTQALVVAALAWLP